jgi:FMN-dependent NADH-azoreductase
MTKVLWVEASPQGARSTSSACARSFLDALSADLDEVAVTCRDVWDPALVRMDGDAAQAKFGPLMGQDHTPEQAEIWQAITDEVEMVRGHDAVIVSSPMWNWHIPHALKNWIDVIVQPLLSFTIDRKGRHVGCLGDGKPVQLVLTRSSAYDGRSPELVDFQRPYLEYVFTMLGYGEIDTLLVEPTTRWTAEERAQMHAEAVASAAAAAAVFAARLAPTSVQ